MPVSRARRSAATAVAVLILTSACSPAAPSAPSGSSSSAQTSSASSSAATGDVDAGKQLVMSKGCIACHTVPGVAGASGTIGPNLRGFAGRPRIADAVPNTPENLRQWLRDPAALKPGTTMPGLNLSDKESDDLAAFLGTLR